MGRIQAVMADVRLMEDAAAYRDLLQGAEGELQRILPFAAHLKPETVSARRQAVEELTGWPDEKPDLKRGLELLAEKESGFEKRRRQEEEKARFPQVTVDKEKRYIAVRIKDELREGQFTQADFMVALLLAGRANGKVLSFEIQEALIAAGILQWAPRQIISRLRRKLEPDLENPQVIVSGGAGQTANYTLRGKVEFVEPEPAVEAKAVKVDEVKPVNGARLQALRLLIEHPQVNLDQLLETLGKNRKGFRFGWNTAAVALKNFAAQLQFRVASNKATEEEKEAWNDMMTAVGIARGQDAKAALRIDRYFTTKRPVKKETNLQDIGEDRLNALEALVERSEILTLAELISKLPKTRQGRDFTWIQAMASIATTVARISFRVQRGVATSREMELWDRVKEFTGGGPDIKTIVVAFRARNKQWFKDSRPS